MASSNLSIVSLLTLAAALSAEACRSDAPSDGASSEGAPSEAVPPAGEAMGAESGDGFAPAVGGVGSEESSIFDLEPAGPSDTADVAACAGQVSQAEFVAVDLFIMLDISGSMLELTPAGADKWTAIQGALASFLTAPSSDGLGVGVQYFPLSSPVRAQTCGSDADCGGVPCLFNTCAGALDLGLSLQCQTNLECGPTALGGLGLILPLGPCLPIGNCSADPTSPCQPPGSACVLDTGATGICELPSTGTCSDGLICDADYYATPAVEIATLPDAAPALLASITAQEPQGGTPSGPALSGAIQQAQLWALSHPGHAVAAVLATDGAATDCAPVDIGGLSDIAALGFQGSPSVRTFAIGVFGNNDLTAPADLDSIARAGGTESAFIIDSTEDVSTQFLEALNTIRGKQLGCDFALPAPTNGGTLDFDLVNVDLTDGGTKSRISRVDSAQDCGGEGGWYYDDPLNPSRIISCPATCGLLEGVMAGASIEIQLGCTTVIR
jgi:hypothetical protein